MASSGTTSGVYLPDATEVRRLMALYKGGRVLQAQRIQLRRIIRSKAA